MSIAPRFLWSGSETPFEAKPAPVVHSQSYTKASNDYENYLVQRASTKMKFQILATSLLIAVTSPFALPMLLFKLRNLDQGIGPSFDTIISAAYVLALGTCALVAHARNVLANYDSKIKTQPTVTSYILSGPVSGINKAKRAYIQGVSNASGYLNAASAATFAAGIIALSFHYYPTGTVAIGAIAGTTFVADSIVTKIKEGTLLKRNTLSAVSHLGGAVSENKAWGLAPAL